MCFCMFSELYQFERFSLCKCWMRWTAWSNICRWQLASLCSSRNRHIGLAALYLWRERHPVSGTFAGTRSALPPLCSNEPWPDSRSSRYAAALRPPAAIYNQHSSCTLEALLCLILLRWKTYSARSLFQVSLLSFSPGRRCHTAAGCRAIKLSHQQRTACPNSRWDS